MGAGAIETKDEDEKEPRPLYINEGCPSPTPSIDQGGMEDPPL